MDGADDDFGDIYADVEAQAASAVNSVPDFTRLYVEPEDDNDKEGNNNTGSGSKDVSLTGDDDSGWSGDGGRNERDLEMEGSDSEDDLNIVLNEDDCQMFHSKGVVSEKVGGVVGASDDEDGDNYFGFDQESSHNYDRGHVAKGSYHATFSQYKYVRAHGAMNSSIAKSSRLAGVASMSLMLARGDCEDNKCNENKVSSSGQAAYPCSTNILGSAQSGYGFSLPWYRTILEVDIESFEHKPWRRPGADVTDFFNFGFDEESWKTYCKSVEIIRQQSLPQTRIAVYDSKPNQGYEAEFESEIVAQEGVSGKTIEAGPWRMVSPESKPSDRGVRHLLPKGRAIRVEGSTCERLPSADVKRPRNRDSDVIQISVQDSMEHSSGLQKREASNIDTNGQDTSESGDFSLDSDMDIPHFSNRGGGELSVEPADKNDCRFESKRCAQMEPASCMMINNLVDGTNDQISDLEGHHCPKDACVSYDNAEGVETVNNRLADVKKNASDTVPCILETGSSDGVEIEHGPSSPFESHSEASEHGVQSDPEKFPNPTRKQSLESHADYQESRTYSFYPSKDSKSKGVKMKTGYCENSLLKDRSLPRGKKTCGWRLNRVGKIHADNNNNNFRHTSDREGRNRSSDNHMRRKLKMEEVGSNSRKDISNRHEIEADLLHLSDRFGENHVQTCERKLHREDHQSIRAESDPYFPKRWDEDEYYIVERTDRVDKKGMERDGYQHKRRPAMKDTGPHPYRESRHGSSKYQSYTYKERNSWCREKDEVVHLKEKNGYDDMLFECRHSFDLKQDNFGISIPLIGNERKSCDKNYGREDYERWERYPSISSLDFDDSMPLRIKDGYWRQGGYQSLSSRSHKEPNNSNGGRWQDMSPRDDACDFKSIELYGRGRRQLCSDRFRGIDQFDRHNHAYKHEHRIIYTDKQTHFGQRRYNWRSKGFLAEDELLCRHQGDESYAEEVPYYREEASKLENNNHMHDSGNVGMLTDEKQLDRHWCKMTRERGRSGRNSIVVRRDKLEQTVLRCRDPVDSDVREGKSSGRSFKDDTLICPYKPGNMDNKSNGGGERNFEDFQNSCIRKAAKDDETETENDRSGEVWLDKFPVLEHDEELDIEEGQIVAEEPDKVVVFERRRAPASAAPTSHVLENRLKKKTPETKARAAGEIDSLRILETRAKMEKRRERFKESPITVKKDHIITGKAPEQCPRPQLDPIDETHESKRRPARKRRWAGN